MRHIDILLCYMCNEWNLQTFIIGKFLSKIVITKFVTKPLAAPQMAREIAFAMEHIDLQTINKDHYKRLTSRRLVSTTNHCVPILKWKKVDNNFSLE